LSAGTVAAIAAVIPLCYLLMIKDIDLKPEYEDSVKRASHKISGYVKQLRDRRE